MRRFLCAALTLLLIFGLASCSDHQGYQSSDPAAYDGDISVSEIPVQSSDKNEHEETSVPAPVQDNLANRLNKIPADCNQLILTVGEGGYSATIYCFARESDSWVEAFSFPGFVGKNGIGATREGNPTSPEGYYSLGTAFGRIENPGTKMPFRMITKDDYWDDDVNSDTYNTWQTSDPPKTEAMDIPAYDYGFVINYNPQNIKGLGSAIFFHISRSYTAGCTGASQEDVIRVLQWLDPALNPQICQCYRTDLDKY